MKRDIFVERDFDVKQAAGSTKLTLRVFRPTRRRTGEYGCAFELRVGGKALRKSRIYGYDAIQALALTLGFVDTEIDRLLATMNGKIPRWQRTELRRFRPKTT